MGWTNSTIKFNIYDRYYAFRLTLEYGAITMHFFWVSGKAGHGQDANSDKNMNSDLVTMVHFQL